MCNKAILVILDGLGDSPALEKTPLQMAKKPNMNKLATKGMQGLMSTISRGIVPGSDTAHLQILGYSPERYYIGRGPFEALGAGIVLQNGDIAFRTNFATVSGNQIIDRRAGRLDTSVAKQLEKELNTKIMKIGDVEIIFKVTTEHRGALVLRGRNLSAKVSPTDSHSIGMLEECKPLDSTPESKKTAEIINKFTKTAGSFLEMSNINETRKKNGLPIVNWVLLRGSGMYKTLPGFEQMHGIRGACIAGGALYKGIAKYVGMDVIEVQGATGTKDTNLIAKGIAAQKALENHDFVFIHVKATDSFSHDGDIEGKTKFIERVDKELIPLLEKTGAALIITSDHSTLCVRKEHTGYEVPILVYEKTGRCDGLKEFDEINAMKGGLGHICGKDLMPIILNILGKSKMYGA